MCSTSCWCIADRKKSGGENSLSDSPSDDDDGALPLHPPEPPKTRVFKKLSSESDVQSFGGQDRVDGAYLLSPSYVITYVLTVKVNVRASEDINSAVTEYWVEGGITKDAQVPLFVDSLSGRMAVPLSGIVKNVIDQLETPRKRTSFTTILPWYEWMNLSLS
jgi:hypothetical protein